MVCLALVLAGCSGRSGAQDDAESSGLPRGDAAEPLAFARCMRAHGLANFPDPLPSGAPAHYSGSTTSPTFTAAAKACAKYADETEPDELTPAGLAAVVDAQLAYARCMRSQGVALTDPIVGANSVVVRLPAGLSPDDPRVEQANSACQAAQEGVLDLIGRYPGDPGTAAKNGG
jgi:hypothetical protein